MRVHLSAGVAALVLLAGAGEGRTQTYVELTGGWTDQPDLMWASSDWEMDRGEHWGAAVGRHFRRDVAVELEYLRTRTNYTGFPDNDLTADSLMANAVYSFIPAARVRPYAGVGVGAVRIGYSPSDAEDTVFGWQVMAGLEAPFFDRVSGFVEYRYQDAATAEDAGLEWEYLSHNLGLGLRYTF